jgi:hypothetical protein
MAASLIFLDYFFLNYEILLIDLLVKLALLSSVIYFICRIYHGHLQLFETFLQQSEKGRVKRFDVFLNILIE